MSEYSAQPFRKDDENELKFFNVFKALFRQTMNDVSGMFDNIYKSYALGKVLYDDKLMPVYGLLTETLFKASYAAILQAQQTLGSPDAYCQILYGIFGSNATITIDEASPLHIKINIVARNVEYFIWADEQKEVYITTEAGDYLGFAALVARVSNRQLADILKQMTNAGTYLEFTYEQGSPDDAS